MHKETPTPTKESKMDKDQIARLIDSIDSLSNEVSRLADIVQTSDLTFNED